MKETCVLIGYGNWGKRIYPSLKKNFKVVKIIKSKDNYKTIDYNDINWAFVITPERTHYKFVNFFLKKKINVFCEKPISLSLNNAKKLINLSIKNNIKLYISDIEIFKKKKIKVLNTNTIIRKKKSNIPLKLIPEKLVYHDFYLLYFFFQKKKYSFHNFFFSKTKLHFEIKCNKKNFIFFYDLSSKKKIHIINKLNFLSKKNYLSHMFKYITKKNCNFIENHNRSLFALKNIEILKKKIVQI